MKFSVLFKDALGKQLVLKGIVAQEELLDIMSKVKFDYVQDGYFTELKESEIITNRVNTVKNMEDMIGVYYSRNFVRKKVLRLSDDDIEWNRVTRFDNNYSATIPEKLKPIIG